MDKYNEEALERAKRRDMEDEDDMIRKHIIDIIKDNAKLKRIPCDAEIAYLEKQKEPRDYRKLYEEVVKSDWFKENYVGKSLGEEQNPAEWSEDDKRCLDEAIEILENLGYDGEADNLKHLRPQPNTVSVENAIKFGNLEYDRGVKDGIQSEKRRQWKPSEEQIGALCYAYCELFKRKDVGYDILSQLQELIDKLQKLL